MKTLLYKTIICLSLVLIASCQEDFLDEPAPTDEISSNIIFGSRTGADAFISGILRRFRAVYTNNHDAGGMNSIYFARVVKGNDFIQTGWFRRDYENMNREPAYGRTRFTWNFSYDLIKQANTLIQGVEASAKLSDEDQKQLIAQGRAIRAFFYFQLAMEFQHTYDYDKTLPAPPIYTAPSSEGKGMSTLEDMYELIVEDLTYATANLTTARLSKSYVNDQVAYGLLARVYQTMHNWPEAEKAAKKAYGGASPSSILNKDYAKSGFSKISDTEWIWGAEQSTDQSNYYLGAPHAQTDHNKDSYKATWVNDDFVQLFSDTDIRHTFEHIHKVEIDHFKYWVTSKFLFLFNADNPYMRIPEMLLIEAEAKYHNGDIAGSQDLLFALQSNRDAMAVKSNNTGKALLDEILVERRKELYGEIGVEWFDAKRYRQGIPRTGNARLKGAASLVADDKRFFLKIPQSEIDANDEIGPDVNRGR